MCYDFFGVIFKNWMRILQVFALRPKLQNTVRTRITHKCQID